MRLSENTNSSAPLYLQKIEEMKKSGEMKKEMENVVQKQRGFFAESLNLKEESYTLGHFESDLYSIKKHLEFWHKPSSRKISSYKIFESLENWKNLNLQSFSLSEAHYCNKEIDKLIADFQSIAIRDALEIIRQNSSHLWDENTSTNDLIEMVRNADKYGSDLSFVGIKLETHELIYAMENGREIEFNYQGKKKVILPNPEKTVRDLQPRKEMYKAA